MIKKRWVIGCDPGPESQALVLYDARNRRIAEVCYSLTSGAGMWLRTQCVHRRQSIAFATEIVACYGIAAGKSLYATAEAVGYLSRCAEEAGVQIVRLSRPEVNLALVGTARAKKPAVNRRLLDMHAPGKGTKARPGPLYGLSKQHMYDALAVAVASSWTEQELADALATS